MNIHDFDDIRPFLPEELPAVYDRLLADPEFRGVMQFVFPDIPADQLEQLIRKGKTNQEFQLNIVYPLLKRLIATAAKSLTANFTALDQERDAPHTFVSNHRDIVLDTAFLSFLLYENGMNTAQVAIGDNLLIRPWIRDLVRINKSFIVQRGLPMRQLLLASAHLSKYMHFCIAEQGESIWIAQREGRAKDSDDRTQESVLKMMAIGGDLAEMNIVPIAITYEYDPCDYLKAAEFQLKRDVEGWKKSPQDDLENMRVGILGHKGKIHYHAAPCITPWLKTLPADMPKTDYFRTVAQHIDQEIHRHYHLYSGNYVAADLLRGNSDHAAHYTADEKAVFEKYLAERIALVPVEKPDEAFLRERILTMYANPVFNHETAVQA